MANIIKPKRSNTANAVPTTGQLASGELGVNMADKKVYINNGTSVVQIGAGALSGLSDVSVTTPANGQSLKYNSTTSKWENATGGTGDVVGPASATDNALVRFDGTTGKLVQNSQGILDDSGNLDIASAKADYFDLDIAAAAPASAVGREAWDDGAGTSILGLKGGVVTYYYGQQTFARVYNGSGAAMSKGQVVYIVGAQGNRIDVRLAQANAESTSANTIGLVAEPIAAGAEGWVQTSGPMPKLVTTGLTAGAAIYLSPTTAGAYTTTKPTAPNHLVVLGFVERVDATVGSIFIKVDNGYELDELHNVNITSPTSGNTLIYDATAGYWENANLTAGTGISVTNGAGSITIANTGVTSVTGTSPVNSSGGAAPAISLASGYGDTQNPYASKTANNFLAAPNGTAGVPTFRAIVAADIPTLNQNTTGTASNVTGTVAIANGGTGATTAAAARTNLGATTVGGNMFTLTNPSAITFPRFNADNTVSALDAATFRTAIGAGTSSTTGTVTSVALSGGTTGLTTSGGPITTSGTITLAGTLAVANGGTGVTTSTGSGSVVLSTSPSLTTPALNGETYSSANVTAGTNAQGQGAITTDNAIIISAPNNPSGVTLPSATTGRCIIVVNKGANPVTVYPASGGQIDALGANAAITLPVNQWLEFNAGSGTQWYSSANALVNTSALAGTVAISQGGSGATTAQAAMNAFAGAVTSGSYLRGNGTNVVMSTIQAADVPTLNQNTTGTAANVTGTVAIANGGTGATTAAGALTNLGAYAASNPSGYTSNTGTVTSIVAGTGLSGGTITTSGTIALANTAVTAGSYTLASITVDAQGRITAASNGTAAGATISDDTTTAATYYPTFATATSGTLSTVKVSSTKLTYNPSTGALTSTSVSASSDESLKTNWRPMSADFLSLLSMVKCGTYDRLDMPGVTQDGVSAQSLQNVLPNSVVTAGEDGKLAVNYGNAALVAAIELAKEVVSLRAEIEKLKSMVQK